MVLALGLPGAPSCNAQQQPLPRESQNPPAAADDCDDEEEEDADEMDADDELELAEVMEQECSDPKSKTADSCDAQLKQLGYLQGGKVVRLKEKDLSGKPHELTIEPGSTVILETKNGKQVVMHTPGPGSVSVTPGDPEPGIYTLGSLFKQSQPAPQAQDDRVRELEQRVRELEAQLRERDGQHEGPKGGIARRAPAQAQAEAERARAAEIRQHFNAQAREFAEQARRQADELRRQAEVFQKQYREQAQQWRVMQGGVDGEPGVMALPRAHTFHLTPPEAAEAPEVPHPDGWWSRTPGATAPLALPPAGPKPPKAAKPPKAPTPHQAHELQAMLEQMRAQMDEIRAQMQALRDELQKAPQHSLR